MITLNCFAVCSRCAQVAGCKCDFHSTEDLIQHELQPLLSGLVKASFFRYFKVSLDSHAALWAGVRHRWWIAGAHLVACSWRR